MRPVRGARLTRLLLPLAAGLLAGCRTAPPPPVPLPGDTVLRVFPRPSPDPDDPVRVLLRKESLGIADLLAIAEVRNPDLAAERKELDLAAVAVEEAGLLPNPSGLVEWEDWRPRDGATIGRMERTMGVRVPIVVGGRIGAAEAVAGKEREVAALRYARRRREVLAGVKEAFVALLAARRSLSLSREARDIARALRDLAEERFRAQVAPEMEVLKAGVHLAEAEVGVRNAEKDLAGTVRRLRALLGGAEIAEERCAGELVPRFAPPSEGDLQARVEESHPLLEEARRSRESAELQVALARAEATPDLGLELTAGLGPGDDAIVEGGFEFPLPVFHRNRPRIAAAEVRALRAGLRVEAVRNDLLLRLADALRGFAAARDLVGSYEEEILPRARKALEQTDEGYRRGKFGYLDVLDAQRTLSEARSAHDDALSELNVRAVELETISGSPLEPAR